MKMFKRVGASMLALGVATAGMVMTAPIASAHNTMLSASSVCQNDGTYLVTYTGTTTGTSGRTATLAVSQILPDGTTVSGAPATVVGNTTFGFTQTVPGTATSASVRVDLHWTDNANAHGSAAIALGGDCKPPVAPSGNLAQDCVDDAGHVFAGKLDNGTVENVSWRLVSGTNGSHTTVVAGPTSGKPLEASGLPDATKVWLQYNAGAGWVDEGSVVTTGNCTPVTPVTPSGTLSTDCVEGAGQVVAADLDSGTFEGVTWRLVTGTNDSHDTVVAGPTTTTPLEANGLPDATKVWLQYKTGENWVDEGSVVTTGNCTPVVVSPTGSFTVVCSDTGADVTVGTLDSGTLEGVTWTLSFGAESKSVTSGDVVAVPALSALTLSYKVGNGPSTTVQEGTAPAACGPTGDRSLGIVKSVSPTGAAEFGDTLTYTLKVTAGGTLGQTNVVVSDYIPGHKPGRDSGTTTYVPGSASCDAGTCTASYDGSAKLVTWGLGDMAAGTSRTVSFKVVIDTPVNTVGAAAGVTIYNSAAVTSTETPNTPSNEVQTPVTAVLGVTHTRTPDSNQPTAVLGVSLAHTGAPAHLPWTLGFAALLLLLGSSLIFLTRQPQTVRVKN
jgi:uncharacterized repeat protein (TIGR01451 family)